MATPVTGVAWRFAVALSLLGAACGTGGGRAGNSSYGAGQPGGSTTTTTVATASGPRGTSGPGQPGTTSRRAQPQPPTTVRRSEATSAPNSTISRTAVRGPGQFAGVLLAPGAARSLVLDVRVQSGASVDGDTIGRIAELLRAQSGKPVAVHGPTMLSDSAQVHDADAIRRLADTQGEPDGTDVAVVHLFYLSGRFSDEGALGVAVRADTAAVFPDEIASATSPFASAARIERAVVTHELGHLLGLVDVYLERNRDDAEHPGHSPNRASVMYYAVESDLVAQLFGGPPPVDFDSSDLADLRTIRAGAAPQN